jgi:hypothetical protein
LTPGKPGMKGSAASPAAYLRALAGLLLLCCLAGCGRAGSAREGEDAVRRFLERYFQTWSDQDMEGYGACFHESARVTYLDQSGAPRTETLSDFLHGQRMGHKTSPVRMTETADTMEVLMDGRAALARVEWTLVKGAEKTRGIDHFSLIQTRQGWKIIHLLFYNH